MRQSFACPRCEYVNDPGTVVGKVPEWLRVCLACAAIVALHDGAAHWLTVDELSLLPLETRASLANAVLIAVSVRPSSVRHSAAIA